MIGLLKAAESFDSERANPDTWFSIKITRAILDGIREHDCLSRGMRKKVKSGECSLVLRSIYEDHADVPSEEDCTLSAEQDDTLEYLMHGLALRDRTIVWMYVRDGLTMKQIAKRIKPEQGRFKQANVSQSAVSQRWNLTILPYMRERAAKLVA